MVLPESPLLTFSFALRALSFSHVLTCSAPRPHSPAQYGVSAPFTSTHASTRRGMEEMSRFSTAPRLLFSQRTAFRTRTRNAFSLSHLGGFVLAKPSAPKKARACSGRTMLAILTKKMLDILARG